ncbi:acetyl-CoA hydrolase/transferase family protein [Paracoccus pantotrophus]|uniref:acetyl-CoA hydrolase/transferase family protein n=1 Tax=Paracoccus pantotrophus TaxID=82367 RepID=UPI0004B2AFC7|nr:acetyl-CoA hydrolase/transferase C-terminal domain-containing protein [Paracoccus pantotrophus]
MTRAEARSGAGGAGFGGGAIAQTVARADAPPAGRRPWTGRMAAPLDAQALGPLLAGAREIYVSGCSAEISDLPGMLGATPEGASITGIFSPILNTQSYADTLSRRRCRTFFLNRDLRRDMASGLVDFCPWTYTGITGWLGAPGRFDTAIVMVSPPDAEGRCSFGTQADFLPDFYRNVPRLIGVINPNMPATAGVEGIPISRFAATFEYDFPLLEIAAKDQGSDPASDAIARNLAGLIPDGATLQMGIGRVPQAMAAALVGHRGLRVHSGLVDDNTLLLERSGALDPRVPITSGVAMGSGELYDTIRNNPRFSFQPTSHTHSQAVIAAIPKFFAINAAIQVDLFGQINSEGSDGRLLASPGGLPEFLRGADQSPGGAAIIALRAGRSRKGEGGIVPRICEPRLVTSPRYDVDIVVTENGVADMRHLSMDERAEALIAVADPAEQAALAESWAQIRSAGFA